MIFFETIKIFRHPIKHNKLNLQLESLTHTHLFRKEQLFEERSCGMVLIHAGPDVQNSKRNAKVLCLISYNRNVTLVTHKTALHILQMNVKKIGTWINILYVVSVIKHNHIFT